jgi:hypothetical protein
MRIGLLLQIKPSLRPLLSHQSLRHQSLPLLACLYRYRLLQQLPEQLLFRALTFPLETKAVLPLLFFRLFLMLLRTPPLLRSSQMCLTQLHGKPFQGFPSSALLLPRRKLLRLLRSKPLLQP